MGWGWILSSVLSVTKDGLRVDLCGIHLRHSWFGLLWSVSDHRGQGGGLVLRGVHPKESIDGVKKGRVRNVDTLIHTLVSAVRRRNNRSLDISFV